MSQISNVYDALLTRMATLFPSKLRMPNPYEVIRNPEPVLRNGWGMVISNAENSERELSGRLSVDRNVNLILVREVLGGDIDTAARATAEKALLEDHFSLVSDLEQDGTVNGTVMLTKYLSDSGIQFASAEKAQYIYIESVFSVEYLESLN